LDFNVDATTFYNSSYVSPFLWHTSYAPAYWQEWRLTQLSNGNYEIRDPHHNLCIDGNRGAYTNPAWPLYFNPFLWECNGDLNQQWILTQVGTEQYAIENAWHTNYCMDGNTAVPQSSLDGWPSPFLWTCDKTAPNHIWTISLTPGCDCGWGSCTSPGVCQCWNSAERTGPACDQLVVHSCGGATCGDNLCCSGSCYDPNTYNCIDGFLCPVYHRKCGNACYLPYVYSCVNNQLHPK